MPLYEGLGYGGEKTVVVLDIGAAYTKCGFAGENGPRCIVSSQVRRSKTAQMTHVYAGKNGQDMYEILHDFLNNLYFRHLLVNPKERRVVVVESIMTTTMFREALAKVLFMHFEVPSVVFAPSHLVTLLTLGIPSALVMDTGFSETVVLPVCEGIPLLKAWQAVPLASESIHSYIESQLEERATIREGQGEGKPLASFEDVLNEDILEDIKVRCCFVTKKSRAEQIQAARRGDSDIEMPAPPPDVEYPLDGSKIMLVPGLIREHACEVLFEEDRDETSIAALVLDCLLKCPIDMRRQLAENVVVVGGTAMLPGFRHRLLAELRAQVDKPKYAKQLGVNTFKLHTTPAKENYAAWLGGAIFGSLEVLASRSVSREQYQQVGAIPDWCAVFERDDPEERGHLMKQDVSKDLPIVTPKETEPGAATDKKTVEFNPVVTTVGDTP